MVRFSCICTILIAMFMYTEASVARVDCSNRKGSSKSIQSWDCKRDGTIICTLTKEDCSSCENYGKVTSGYTTYEPYENLGHIVHLPYLIGAGGWDCKRKCSSCRGDCSGKEEGGGGGGSRCFDKSPNWSNWSNWRRL